jgi:hypothetical protein
MTAVQKLTNIKATKALTRHFMISNSSATIDSAATLSKKIGLAVYVIFCIIAL